MFCGGEIVTLQFGNYSNYVGTHWWNTQEFSFSYNENAEPSEINHDILYREGLNYKGQVTYTPRLLLLDLKGSLKQLPETGELYDEPITETNEDKSDSTGNQEIDEKIESEKSKVLWDFNGIEVIKKEALPVNTHDYQKNINNTNDTETTEKTDYNFTETVTSWTDYLYSRYHPRSINLIKSYQHDLNENPFDTYTNGMNIWRNEQFDDEFCDRIRQYVEECNNCQGFQTLFDCCDGFSGITTKCLEHLNDEYGKVNLAIPIFQPRAEKFKNADQAMSDSIRVINIALTYCSLFEQSSLILPISTMGCVWRTVDKQRKFPYINYKSNNFYQTSAILSSYLDTISLRYRIQQPTYSSNLSGFCVDLNKYGRKLIATGLALPFGMNENIDLIDYLAELENPLFTQLSPNTKIGTDKLIQSISLRGIPQKRLKRPLKSAEKQRRLEAYKCDTISEMLQFYFECNTTSSQSHVSVLNNGMNLNLPYPCEIFDKRVNFNGFLTDFEITESSDIKSCPVLAVAQSSNDIENTIDSLHNAANRIKISKIHRFKETGLESDEYIDALEKLLEFKDNYDDCLHL